MWQRNYKDNEAFYEDLCNKYYERIYNYCKKLVKGQRQFLDFVEECTQNTFLEARKQLLKLEKHPNVEGWLYTTARNLINNSFRSSYIKKKYEVNLEDNISGAFAKLDDKLERLFDSTADLDKLCVEVLNKLHPSEYDLYMDYYKSKMPISELAKKYAVSATAMTTRIYRLKKKLKNIIHNYFEENEV